MCPCNFSMVERTIDVDVYIVDPLLLDLHILEPLNIMVDIGITGRSDVDPYVGPYTCTPTSHNQLFETQDLLMEDDFLVYKIPYHESPNQTGITVTIGGA